MPDCRPDGRRGALHARPRPGLPSPRRPVMTGRGYPLLLAGLGGLLAALFLASPASDFINGQHIIVDGGQSAR